MRRNAVVIERMLPPVPARALLRKAAGVSQRDLGADIGVTGMTVGRWEDGSRTPSAEEAERYVALLRALVYELLGGESS